MNTHTDSDSRDRRTDHGRPETAGYGPDERSSPTDGPRPGPTATGRSTRPTHGLPVLLATLVGFVPVIARTFRRRDGFAFDRAIRRAHPGAER